MSNLFWYIRITAWFKEKEKEKEKATFSKLEVGRQIYSKLTKHPYSSSCIYQQKDTTNDDDDDDEHTCQNGTDFPILIVDG